MRGFALRVLVPVGVVLIGVLITLSLAGAFGGSQTSRSRQTAALGVAAPSSGFTTHVQVIPPPKGAPAAVKPAAVPTSTTPTTPTAGPTGATGTTGAAGAAGAAGALPAGGTTKIKPKPASVPAEHVAPVKTPPVEVAPVTIPKPVAVVKPTPQPVFRPRPRPVVRPKPKPVVIPVVKPIVIPDTTPAPPPAASSTKPSPLSGTSGLQAPGG